LTEVINEKHENVKYLPGVSLPTNIVAVPDASEAVKGGINLLEEEEEEKKNTSKAQ